MPTGSRNTLFFYRKATRLESNIIFPDQQKQAQPPVGATFLIQEVETESTPTGDQFKVRTFTE